MRAKSIRVGGENAASGFRAIGVGARRCGLAATFLLSVVWGLAAGQVGAQVLPRIGDAASASPSALSSAPSSPTIDDEALKVAAIANRLALVRKEIAAIADSGNPGLSSGATGAGTEADRDSLDAIETLLVAQLELAKRQEARGAKAAEKAEPAEESASIPALAALYAARERSRSSEVEADQARTLARAKVAAARAAFEAAERLRRQAAAELDRQADGAARDAAEKIWRARERSSRIAHEELQLRRLEAREQKPLEGVVLDAAEFDRRIASMRQALASDRFAADSLNRPLVEHETALRRERVQRERELDTVRAQTKSGRNALCAGDECGCLAAGGR